MADKIVFDDGIKEFEINGDPNRILRINLADIGLVDRMKASLDKMKDELKDIDLTVDGESTDKQESVAEFVRTLNKKLREGFDEMFYPGASEAVFWVQNPLSTASNGATIYENFIESFTKLLEPEFKKAQKKSEKHMAKYKEALDKASAFKSVTK